MRIFLWLLLTFDVAKTNFQSHTQSKIYTETRAWQLANVNIIELGQIWRLYKPSVNHLDLVKLVASV